MKFDKFLISTIIVGTSSFSLLGNNQIRNFDRELCSVGQRTQDVDQETTSDNNLTEELLITESAELSVPYTFDEMVQQASATMKAAYETGVKRQVIRVLLPRDPNSGQLGQYFEADAELDKRDLVLAPPDETWQGGIMQLYRACAPTCQAILTNFVGSPGGIPPRTVEDRSIDESGVDGIGLWMTECPSPADDVSCFVQPSQETINSIETISQSAGDRLVMLLNPQWRNVDDALDAASKTDGVFGKFASFLGGKGDSLKRLEALGYENVYTLEGYVCKGGNVRLLKLYNSDWAVFAENDSATDFIFVGSSEARPTYQDVDKMLDEKGITLKYARDMGFAPKL
mmetsp:Transcript_17320/g.26237  ORF Transcript_17320/g.26237 Transcript_17320/m.26237 type:complete len:342 (+) Transcript_17320:93-1118(+)